MKTMLTAQDVFSNLNAVRTVEVDVPELGGTLRIRELTALEGREFADEAKKNTGALRLVMMCAVDAEGNQLFNDGDFERLSKLGMAAVMRVQKAALKLNGLTEETETVKNG